MTSPLRSTTLLLLLHLPGCLLLTGFLQPLSCGDGFVSEGEACDDGNNLDSDGCDALCQREAPAGCEQVPPLGEDLVFDDTNNGLNNTAPLGCAGGEGPELVYALTPTVDGLLSLSLVGSLGFLTFDAALYVRADCGAPESELLCAEPSFGVIFAAVNVVAGVPLFIFVDGVTANDTGNFFLQFELCGDGLVTGNEDCDDGNNLNDDGCDADCTLPCLGQQRRPDRALIDPVSARCLAAFDVSLSWDEAERECVVEGGHLVSINDLTKNDLITQLANNQEAWIGSNDLSQEGSFIWSDNTPFFFQNFSTGNPNNLGGAEDCVELLSDGTWNDTDCSRGLPYVCELP